MNDMNAINKTLDNIKVTIIELREKQEVNKDDVLRLANIMWDISAIIWNMQKQSK